MDLVTRSAIFMSAIFLLIMALDTVYERIWWQSDVQMVHVRGGHIEAYVGGGDLDSIGGLD